MPESEISPEELAALADAMDLQVGYSMTEQRAFVTLEGELMYAVVVGKLDLDQPGMWRLQDARVKLWSMALRAEEQRMLAAMPPLARERYEAEQRRVRGLPDPTDAQIDRYRERMGE